MNGDCLPGGLKEMCLSITTDSDVAVCQVRTRGFAAAIGFGLRVQWEIAIAVSEAVTNILKYAGKGSLTLRHIASTVPGIEFEAVDEGRGMGDVSAALLDGISQGRNVTILGDAPLRQGLGLGLGAITRMMDSLEIKSTPRGTTLRAVRWLV